MKAVARQDKEINLEIPAWALDLFKQTPTLGICLLVVWYASKRIFQQHDRQLNDLQKMLKQCLQERKRLLEKLLKSIGEK